MSSQFIRGEIAHITLSVTDTSDAPADPGSLLFKAQPPTGNVVTYTYGTDAEVVRSAVGEYYIDLPLTSAGPWYYRWELSGSNAGAGEGSISVTPGYF
jgi:hypothetical protein